MSQQHELEILSLLRNAMDEATQRGRQEGLVSTLPIITWMFGENVSLDDLKKWTLNLFEKEAERLGVDIRRSIDFHREILNGEKDNEQK